MAMMKAHRTTIAELVFLLMEITDGFDAGIWHHGCAICQVMDA